MLSKLQENDQTVFRYCDDDGIIVEEFPTNPNGSMYNLAAVCNPSGNVMAMMPHPERTEKGDVIFSSMKTFIEADHPTTNHELSFERPHFALEEYETDEQRAEWVIDMIITDNEAASVQNALNQLGFDVEITRQTHWEIGTNGNRESILQQIDASGELYNSNKEFISNILHKENSAALLVRQKEDIKGRSKFESLRERFEIDGITHLTYGTIWNVTIASGNLDTVLGDILETHIFFNPLSHDCYKIQ